MCGRYYIEDEDTIIEMRQIIDEINRKHGDEGVKTGEIYPTNRAPVQIASGTRMESDAMRWGFPRWQGNGVVINARSETAAEKTMFRKSLMERRAVIPTTGFYEWTHVEGKKSKDKFLFRKNGEKTLYLAGMFNLFTQEDGTKEARFTILTTNANESMSPFHDRMPVILDAGEREEWLLEGNLVSFFLSRQPPILVAKKESASNGKDNAAPEQLGFDLTTTLNSK